MASYVPFARKAQANLYPRNVAQSACGSALRDSAAPKMEVRSPAARWFQLPAESENGNLNHYGP